MENSILGKTGLKISPIVFGGIVNMNETQEDANHYVSYAINRGVNYFDVAPSYGDAEKRLGPALMSNRSNVYLACKTHHRDAVSSKEDLLSSLKQLQTDYFDVYQLHAITTQEDIDKAFGQGGVMETMLWAKREGLIRNIGFSTHNEDIALKALDLYDFDTVLFPMNWALGIIKGWGDRISSKVLEKNIGLLAMKTFVHRLWFEGEERVYPKSWCKPIFGFDELGIAAMKYGIYKGGVSLVPPGNFEHFCFMLDNIDECISNPLSIDEWALLKREAEKVRDHLIF